MTRKRASFLSRHPEERSPPFYPRCNATDNRTSPLRQRFGDEREERRVEEESIQACTPSGLPSCREPRPLPPARSEQQPGQEPEQITKLVELAESHLAAGETRQAVVLLEEAVARNSHDLRLLLLLGKAREAQGDHQGAVDAYLTIEAQLQASPAGRQRDDREVNAAAEEINQSRVETAMAPGMLVSSTGRRDPARFPTALREAVEKHRADLQAVCDRERATNPTLMGSVVLGLTIEPNGRVSQARVQAAKLPNPRLSERVLSLARAWQFAPAAGRVSVSYPLLFLPPRVDMASVIAWERNTAVGRSTVSAPAPVPAADMEPSPAHTPIEQAEARQRSTGSDAPERSDDTAKALAVAEPEKEEGHEAPPGSGQRFVHPELGYSITPPPGFTLLQTGQRTIWQGPEGTQLLVETTSTPGRSARAGWEELHAALAKRYGSRYRSYGITETQLAGRPAAAWEFLLTTAVGTRHKLDVAVLDGGVGYVFLSPRPPGASPPGGLSSKGVCARSACLGGNST